MNQQTALNKKKLTSLKEMFGDLDSTSSQAEDKRSMIDVDLLVPFKDHPFKPYTGKRFDGMVRSIKDLGVLQPVIIRPIPNDIKREILAGHNRWRAAIAAGLREIPYVEKEGLSQEEAMLIVTETNLIQRSFTDLAHSERAYVLAQHYAAIKSQGKRMDIINEVKRLLNADEIRENETSGPEGRKLDSRGKTAKEYDLSERMVARYLKINRLDEELKKWIDDESISIKTGEQLSYLSSDNQLYLVDILNNHNIKIDEKLAASLRELEKTGKLNEQSMIQVITGTYKRPKQTASVLKGVKVKPLVLKKYFNEKQSVKEVEDIIDKALALYFSKAQSEEAAK